MINLHSKFHISGSVLKWKIIYRFDGGITLHPLHTHPQIISSNTA
jgi:hypothetical protein